MDSVHGDCVDFWITGISASRQNRKENQIRGTVQQDFRQFHLQGESKTGCKQSPGWYVAPVFGKSVSRKLLHTKRRGGAYHHRFDAQRNHIAADERPYRKDGTIPERVPRNTSVSDRYTQRTQGIHPGIFQQGIGTERFSVPT